MTCPKIYCGPVDFNISKSVWLRIRFVKYLLSTAPLKSLTEIAFGPVFDISNWPIPKTLAWLLGGIYSTSILPYGRHCASPSSLPCKIFCIQSTWPRFHVEFQKKKSMRKLNRKHFLKGVFP